MTEPKIKAQRGDYLIGMYERDILGEGDRNIESQYLIMNMLNDLDHFCARKGYNFKNLFEQSLEMDTPKGRQGL